MSRLEVFEYPKNVSTEFAQDEDIQLWLSMGRLAYFVCLWVGMAIPVLLLWSIRF